MGNWNSTSTIETSSPQQDTTKRDLEDDNLSTQRRVKRRIITADSNKDAETFKFVENILLNHLECGDEKIIVDSLCRLADTLESEACACFMQLDGPQAIVRLMNGTPASFNVQRFCISLLALACRESKDNALVIGGEHHGIHAILAAMRTFSSNEKLVLLGLRALYSLTVVPTNCNLLGAVDVEFILICMDSNNPEIVLTGCRIIVNLLCCGGDTLLTLKQDMMDSLERAKTVYANDERIRHVASVALTSLGLAST